MNILFLVCTDNHGDFKTIKELMKSKNFDIMLSCGDVTVSYGKAYDIPSFDKPFYFISGNHETEDLMIWDNRDEPIEIKDNVWFVPRPCLFELDGHIILGVGGNYSKKDWHKVMGMKAWHYNKYIFEDAKKLAKNKDVDILLTHEASIGIKYGDGRFVPPRPEIRDLVRAIQPRVHVFGHHHTYVEGRIGETDIYGLPYPDQKVLFVDYKEEKK